MPLLLKLIHFPSHKEQVSHSCYHHVISRVIDRHSAVFLNENIVIFTSNLNSVEDLGRCFRGKGHDQVVLMSVDQSQHMRKL